MIRKWKSLPQAMRNQIGACWGTFVPAILLMGYLGVFGLTEDPFPFKRYLVMAPLLLTLLGGLAVVQVWRAIDSHGGIRIFAYPCIALGVLSLVLCWLFYGP